MDGGRQWPRAICKSTPIVALPKLAASKGIALMPLLTNLVGDTWQPEAVENLAHGPADRQDRFIQKVLDVLRDAKAAGVVVDWEQIDPAYKKDITVFLDKLDGRAARR